MIEKAIEATVAGQSLSIEESRKMMTEIMSGEATEAQIGAVLTSLRLKGETPEEIAGMAQEMRDKAVRMDTTERLVDTCGTGGDAKGTFNISTTAAFVVAATGLKVAKHGNRAMSGSCGSADVLEALGVKIDLGPNGVKKCIDNVGMGFMFAPVFHPAMKNVAGPRREIGIRTVFNILGPLSNPARAKTQLLGVSDASIGEKLAQVLKHLGTEHALVVHGEDGMDEVTLCGKTKIWELKNGEVREFLLDPEELGLSYTSIDTLQGGSLEKNRSMAEAILNGTTGPMRDIVLLNAAAAIIAAGTTDDWKEAISLGAKALDSGNAGRKLTSLVEFSNKAESNEKSHNTE